MTRIAVKDFSDPEHPKVLIEYEFDGSTGFAEATVVNNVEMQEDLEEEWGAAIPVAPGQEKAVFPEDGVKFMEGLFWKFGRGMVVAVAEDAGAEAVEAALLRRVRAFPRGGD